MEKKNSDLVFLFAIIFLFVACKKKFDIPPLKTLETSSKINIQQIKAKFSNTNYRFRSDSSLYCVVIADEVSGNLYKDIFVRDLTGALHVKLVSSGGLFIGDSIRINLQNCILNASNNLIQLDSVDSEKSIVKLSSGLNPQPILFSIKQIITTTLATNDVQSKLIQLNNVEFMASDLNQSYADAIGKTSCDRILKSCDGFTIAVRTSGYASFASKTIENGNGSFIGIVSQFGNKMQLLIRNLNDLNMKNPLCGTTNSNTTITNYLFKDFNDNSITSNGWLNYTVTNTVVKWSTSSFSNTPSPFAKISGYANGVNSLSETWLISPNIDLSFADNPVLSFVSAAGKYAGPPLDVLVSTDYSMGTPSLGNWTSIASMCVLSPTTTSYVWTASGEVSLNNFKTNNVRVAFKYTSSINAACTYQLDDIKIKEK